MFYYAHELQVRDSFLVKTVFGFVLTVLMEPLPTYTTFGHFLRSSLRHFTTTVDLGHYRLVTLVWLPWGALLRELRDLLVLQTGLQV